MHIHKNLSTINVIQWHENNIKLLLIWSSTPSPIFPPEKGCFGYNPQYIQMHLLVERSDHLTDWLDLFWWNVGNDFYTVLIWVHATYNMGKVRSIIYVSAVFLWAQGGCMLVTAQCIFGLQTEWRMFMYWRWSHCKKIYFISTYQTFLPYLRPNGVQKGFWWHFYILVQKYRSVVQFDYASRISKE